VLGQSVKDPLCFADPVGIGFQIRARRQGVSTKEAPSHRTRTRARIFNLTLRLDLHISVVFFTYFVWTFDVL